MFKKELKEEISKINDNTLSNKALMAEIKAKIISIDSKVTALLKMWEPTPSTGTNTTPVKCKTTLIEFADKHQFNINFVKRDFKTLRLKNAIPADYYKMGNNGRRKRFLISEEAEKILLDYMRNKSQEPQQRIAQPKVLTKMSKEELIKEIYKKNQQLKRKAINK